MFDRTKNGAAPGPGLTLGAAREKLVANGYTPVSALTLATGPAYLVSEHPVVLKTLGAQPLAALLLKPPADSALEERIRDALGKRGLTHGPVRIGSDGSELYPLRPSGAELIECSALEDAVTLICVRSRGGGSGLEGSLVPTDGAWPQRTLLEVPYVKLPALSTEEARALFEELSNLPYKIAEEREPVRPSRRAWLGVR